MIGHKDVCWGVHNFGALVYPTIQHTRTGSIASALSLSIPDPIGIEPTARNLKKYCPHYKVVKLSIYWEGDTK